MFSPEISESMSYLTKNPASNIAPNRRFFQPDSFDTFLISLQNHVVGTH